MLARVRKFILPSIAIIGFIHALRVVALGNNPPPIQEPLTLPAKSHFEQYVAGSGIVESRSENVAVASQISGVVERVHVTLGQMVAREDPLFEIDGRSLRAQEAVQEAEAQVAEAQLEDARRQLELYRSLADKRAISEDERIRRTSAFQIATAQNLAAQARVNATRVELERLVVRSPVEGSVLQIKIRPGEYAPAQVLAQPLMLVGDTKTLHVRVDIDENDAWRIKAGARAEASLRGNPEIRMTLSFVRFEPYVVPKVSLTGSSSERVDTRVLQLIYKVENPPENLFVGQLMDVFVDTQGVAA